MWEPVPAPGSEAARLHSPLGCFGVWGLFLAAPQGPRRRCSPGAFGVVPGCVEVGALWAEGLGALTHGQVRLRTPMPSLYSGR